MMVVTNKIATPIAVKLVDFSAKLLMYSLTCRLDCGSKLLYITSYICARAEASAGTEDKIISNTVKIGTIDNIVV